MILIDTHVLLWWLSDPKKLSKKAANMIHNEKTQGTILISSMSIWETCMLVKKGRLGLGMDTERWLKTVESLPYLQFIPLTNTILAKSVNLPEPFHNDPADRMIVATAREYGGILITSDAKIQHYPHVQTIW